MTTMRPRILFAGLCSLAACASGGDATPEQRTQAERRLLTPFLAAREVGCGELFIEVTSNLYAYVGQPAVDAARHRQTRERGDGFVETTWTNLSGAPDAAFVVTVGEPQQLTETGWVLGQQTRFRVVNQVRVRVYEDRRPLTLNATAGGAFVLVKEAATKPQDVKEFAIVDGVLRKS
jgi:hypothetical protein